MPEISVTETGPTVTVSAVGIAGPEGAPGVVQSVNGQSVADVVLTAGDVGAVPAAGGTMTGPLILDGDPVDDLGAATRQFVLANAGSGGGGGAVASVNGHTGAVVLGATDVGALAKTSNLSDLPNAATARANLGLGSSATRAVGTAAGTVAAGDDARIVGAVQTSSAASSVVAETSYGQGSAVGTATTFAREDHTHGTTALASSAPAVTEGIGQAGAVGTATVPARADHVHPLAAAGTPGSSAVGDVAASGSAATFAASDHVHGREAFGGAPAVTESIGQAAASGTATTPARSDHVHPMAAAGTPGSSAVGDAAATGSATTYAASDHRHGREAFAAPAAATTYGLSPVTGTAATVAHSDHTHGTPALPTSAPPTTQAIGTAAAVGSATLPALSDHVHPMAAAGAPSASAVGDAQATGVATTFAASDHRHAREAFAAPGSSAVGDTASAGVAATVAHSDHRHGREGFGTPGSSAVGDGAAAGSAVTPARSDHTHGREGFGAVTALSAFGTASANGTATTVSHSDHVHGAPALPAATTSVAGIVQLDGVAADIAALGTAAAGSVGKAADAGHVHPTTGVVLTSQLPLSVANGGTGASPTAAGLTPTTTASGVAAWLGTPGPVYNVLAYGADATGVADSTSALQAAINAAQASAGIVYLPAGTFMVAGIPQITGSNITIRGAGTATTIKLGSASANSSGTVIGLWVNGGSNITIESLAFDGNFTGIAKDGGVVVASTLLGSSALGAAVVTTPAAGTTETWTVNAAGAAATAGYSGVPLVVKVDSEQVLVTGGQGTTSWQVRRGFASTTPATHSNGAAIVNTEGVLFDAAITKYGTNSPKVYKSSQYAGGVDASTYLHQRMPVRITNASNVTVRGCLVQNSVSAGILADATSVNGCTDIKVVQNRVKLTWDNGIYFHQGVQTGDASDNDISDTMYNGVSAVYCDHIDVVGNQIRNAGPSFSDSGGIQINGSSNCQVAANQIDAGQFYGIDVLSTQETNITGGAGGNQVWSSNTTLANNAITNCKAADYPSHNAPGINLFGSTGAKITGNSISGCDYGISMGSKATLTSIIDNQVVSCGAIGINVGNSADVVGTVVRDNYIAYNGSNGIYGNAGARYENNTIVGNGSMGINLSQPPSGVPSKIDWIINNTIIDNADSGVYANAGAGCTAVIKRNVFGNSPAVIFNDASITFNNATFTSATANFTSADVGLPLVFMNQGSFGVTTATTVQSVTNSTTAVAASAPQATETGVSFWIGRGPATYTDGSTTNAANSVLTSATAAFTSSDAGKLVVLMSQTLTPSVLFAGTIQSVTNATTAVLSGAAGAIGACTIVINRSAGQQIRAINNGSGLVVDDGNTVWGIPEILTGGATYTVQAVDRVVVRDSSPTLDRTARNVVVTTLTAPRTITLPDAAACMNQTVTIKDESGSAGSNTVTVATQSAQTIDGASTTSITAAYGAVVLYSNGTGWFTRQTLINRTAGTIAALGTQAAGSTGLSADAGHVHPTTGLVTSGSAASGDLSGTYPAPTVAKVNGVTITGTPTAGQVPQAINGTSAAWTTLSGGGGSGTPASTVVTETGYGQSSAVGTGTNYAREDHTHGSPSLTSSAATTSAVGDAAAAGTATTPARADHTHGREGFGTPGTSAVGDSATAGSATTLARSDHKHGREAFGSVVALTAFNTASSSGTATTLARSDHVHGVPDMYAHSIPSDYGWVEWNFAINTANQASQVFASGTIYGASFIARTNKTVSNLVVAIQSSAVTPTAGQNLAALYSVSGTTWTRIAATGDLSTWGSSGQTATLSLGGSVTLAAGQTYVVLFLSVAATPVKLYGWSSSTTTWNNMGLSNTSAPWFKFFVEGSSQTALPASFVASSSTMSPTSALAPWFALS